MKDLTLVSIEDLIKEIEIRCSSFMAAYEHYENKKKLAMFYYGKGNFFDAVRLSSMLNNDVLNNWNGEMRTLQRINEDETEEDE